MDTRGKLLSYLYLYFLYFFHLLSSDKCNVSFSHGMFMYTVCIYL